VSEWKPSRPATRVGPAGVEITERDIELAKSGDQVALGKIFRRYNSGLVRYLRGLAISHAEDVAGQVWVEVAGSLHRFSGDDEALRRWLYTIARRRMVDVFRSQKRRPEELVAMAQPMGAAESADAWVERLEWAENVLQQLPQMQAEVVLLRVVAGFSVDEVASMLGKSPGAVRVLAHRGLQRVLEILAGEDEPSGLTAAFDVSVLFNATEENPLGV
jgi:RNA polymerase sigma-70 factor (ECF subfamily)